MVLGARGQNLTVLKDFLQSASTFHLSLLSLGLSPSLRVSDKEYGKKSGGRALHIWRHVLIPAHGAFIHVYTPGMFSMEALSWGIIF